ncbi:MAG: phenylalanine--tRNA ligase subunit beta [Verrucomicrobia bacterium]|nr:phenylalanine--tRNA ligase subunit beta [Verrucomicrobiota bacterium]
MKVTLNWLKQYVDFDWTPEELAERLTMLGLEVEGVEKHGGEFEGIIVAQVVSRDRVAGSDKLSVCRVHDGKGERQVICGAQNFKAGDKVALILPGASLPAKPGEAPFTIKVRKVMGVESHGMLCSPKELGLADDADGILILPDDAKVGQSFAEHLGRAGSDVIYDLEITPNRPDLNSVIGIAREIAALTGNSLRIPSVDAIDEPSAAASSESKNSGPECPATEEWIAIQLDSPDLCPRYVARIVQGIKIGPSPSWMRQTLEKVGIRSISNVVDVTNFVMLECGQPLHAFDYHLISGVRSSEANSVDKSTGKPTIIVRKASQGEKFVTLDNREHTLTDQELLIADSSKGIALAGIMGGQNTEINDETVDVLIETACFHPANIRATSKRLELRTESSYRFERGADIGIADWASRRCAALILKTAGGHLAPGVVDAFPNPPKPKEIRLRYAKSNDLLGITIEPAEQNRLLISLALDAVSSNATEGTFRVPTHRVDLKREIDLIEEICRLYGIDKIPGTTPRGAIGENSFDTVHDQLAEVRRMMTALGLNEAQGQTLISDNAARLVSAEAETVFLAHPLSADMNALRPSLIPGLLNAFSHNLHHRNSDVAGFEIGRIFSKNGNTVTEERHLAIALTGLRKPPFWTGDDRTGKFDIFDLKGLVEEFLEQFGIPRIAWIRRPDPTTLFVESAAILLGGKLHLGEIGQLQPALAKLHDLRDSVLIAQLNLDEVLARRNRSKTFKPIAPYPSVRRDVAMLVPESTTHESVASVVRQSKAANLEKTELFDVFRGKNVEASQKSMAYAFTYRHSDRTLTDTEVNTAHEKLVALLKQKLGAVVRD